jgi:hypothetical protein
MISGSLLARSAAMTTPSIRPLPGAIRWHYRQVIDAMVHHAIAD